MTQTDSVHRPAHVRESDVVDVDIYAPLRDGEMYHDAFTRLHREGVPPIFWTPHNGGHWVVSDSAAMYDIFADHQRFTSDYLIVPKEYNPSGEFRQAPIQTNPPEHGKFRSLFSSAFIAPAVRAREGEVRALAIELADRLQPQGRCDFTLDFAHHLPMKVFMNMVDLPDSDREALIALADRVVGPNTEDKSQIFFAIADYLGQKIDERSASPGDDLISKIVTSKIDGEPIKRHDAVSVCSLLLIGGLDTVASMMGFVIHYLATHPAKRQELVDQPELIPAATEEFLRRFALTSPGRMVAEDMTYGDVTLKKGEMILLSTPFSAVDPNAYEDAESIDFKRKAPRMMTFGNGPHRCPGNMLARAELRVMLEEWLTRVPDFRLDPKHPPIVRSGVNGSIASLPLVWDA
jgi:cytochrome P450